mmetsp:Transcript_21728/g.35841  ORF Transcript_21728/g.35841 Transcript_21728/m.35841 type:complete len:308 (+) Transcript_21728:178-1101(+)
MKKLPPAQSDWEALRSHFQFVLPDEDEDESSSSGARKYGSSWQERMVQHYHSHLYKEYVLADLSRVLEIGKVGLRWRTEDEVKSGRGFRSCGNLKCQSACHNNLPTSSTEKKEAYDAVVRRSVGIGVPENGGKEPLGVVLPLSTSSGAGEALDRYLKSCVRKTLTSDDEDSDSFEDKRSRKRRKKSKRQKRHHKHPGRDVSLQDEERDEQKRLSQIPYGVGLYDYEVDFAYVEQNVSKRELVKVRLCLRCAPLLFAAKDVVSKSSNPDDKIGPATKARNVRLMAMEAARDGAKVADDDGKDPEANVK